MDLVQTFGRLQISPVHAMALKLVHDLVAKLCTHGCYDSIEYSLLIVKVFSMVSSYEKICSKQNYQCS